MDDSDLEKTHDEVLWALLKPFAKRDRLIVVAPELDLIEVATAFAQNQVALSEKWVQQKKVRKPTAEEIAEWDLDAEKKFMMAVVQPWVLAQELPALAKSM